MKKKKFNLEIKKQDNNVFVFLNDNVLFENANEFYEEIKKHYNNNYNLIIYFTKCQKADTSLLACLSVIQNYFKSIIIKCLNDEIKYILTLWQIPKLVIS